MCTLLYRGKVWNWAEVKCFRKINKQTVKRCRNSLLRTMLFLLLEGITLSPEFDPFLNPPSQSSSSSTSPSDAFQQNRVCWCGNSIWKNPVWVATYASMKCGAFRIVIATTIKTLRHAVGLSIHVSTCNLIIFTISRVSWINICLDVVHSIAFTNERSQVGKKCCYFSPSISNFCIFFSNAHRINVKMDCCRHRISIPERMLLTTKVSKC